MSVTVKMTGDERDLVKAQERVEKGAAGITAEYRKLAKESLETQRYAKKAWEESLPPLQRYEMAMEKLNRAYQGSARETDEYRAAVAKLQNQYGAMGGEISALASQLKTVAAGYLGINEALQFGKEAFANYEAQIKTTSDAASKGIDKITTFAALQEPGVGRERALRVLRESAGVSEGGEALNLVAAMQSAVGPFESGLEIARTVWQAARVGIPAEIGAELATQALAQGYDPVKFIQEAYVAGKVSERDPAAVARAAPALELWQDKTYGTALAAKLAGTKGLNVESSLKGLSAAIQQAGPLAEYWKTQGIGPEATDRQRIEHLRAKGIDTIAELNAIGLKEIDRVSAVVNVVAGYDKVLKFEKEITDKVAAGNVLQRDREEINRQFPEAVYDKAADAAVAMYQQYTEFGPETEGVDYERIGRLSQDVYRRQYGAELQRRGVREGWLGRDYMDDAGRMTGGGLMRAWIGGLFDSRIRESREAAGKEAARVWIQMIDAFEKMEKAQKQTAENTDPKAKQTRPRSSEPER